jgi:hypothetical protein
MALHLRCTAIGSVFANLIEVAGATYVGATMPTSFSVANEAQLNAAIQQIDVGGASAATNTAY